MITPNENNRTIIVFVESIEFWHKFNAFINTKLLELSDLNPELIIDENVLNYKVIDVFNMFKDIQLEFIADQFLLFEKYPDKTNFESKLFKIGKLIFMPEFCNVSNDTKFDSYKARTININIIPLNDSSNVTKKLIYGIINTVMNINTEKTSSNKSDGFSIYSKTTFVTENSQLNTEHLKQIFKHIQKENEN